MKKIILLFFCLFLTQCSTSVNPESAWKENAYGMWYLTSEGSLWLTSTLGLETAEGDVVFINEAGNFTISETTFTFKEIDSTGVFAVYQISSTEYIALGFNSDYDILFNATVFSSTEITTTTTGNILMTK